MRTAALVALTLLSLAACVVPPTAGPPPVNPAAASAPPAPGGDGVTASPATGATGRLFDGHTLAGWRETEFVGGGAVMVRDGAIVLSRGDPMTGITWEGDFPRIGYELSLEAMRVEGRDFFSAITFPVGAEHNTLVLGGWGGGVVGLSSIGGADASENETRRYLAFENGRWYRVRLRVTEERIEAWVDERQMVDFPHRDRLLSLRVEVMANRPFGIATWMTTGALRDLELRLIPSGS